MNFIQFQLKVWPFIFFVSLFLMSASAFASKCLYIASYHEGYQWADEVEKGLRQQLKGKCEIKQFNMDTKRHTDEAFKKAAGLKAKALIESWQPDVVIASDDNASEYVIKPYFKNHTIPVVFCGINWNVDAYGYPYRNATGMVEVAPINELFKKVTSIIGKPRTAFYLGVDVVTERKNLKRFEEEASSLGITLKHGLAMNMQQWLDFYREAQATDFVIIGSNAGINDWNKKKVIDAIKQSTDKLSVTIQDWVMDYTIFGLTKIASEQGEWAGKVVLAILNGTSPAEIPIISNRKWDMWLNPSLLKATTITLPVRLIKKARKVVID